MRLFYLFLYFCIASFLNRNKTRKSLELYFPFFNERLVKMADYHVHIIKHIVTRTEAWEPSRGVFGYFQTPPFFSHRGVFGTLVMNEKTQSCKWGFVNYSEPGIVWPIGFGRVRTVADVSRLHRPPTNIRPNQQSRTDNIGYRDSWVISRLSFSSIEELLQNITGP